MALSLGIAVAAEELIFGKVFRLLLVRQAVQVKPVLIKPVLIKTGQRR